MQDNAPAPAPVAAASIGSSPTLEAILAIKNSSYCQYKQLERDRRNSLDFDSTFASPLTLESLKFSDPQTRTEHGFNWVVINMKCTEEEMKMKMVEVTSLTWPFMVQDYYRCRVPFSFGRMLLRDELAGVRIALLYRFCYYETNESGVIRLLQV